MIFKGPSGALKWGYRVVASLGPWSCSNGTFTATLTTCDEIGIEESPLVVTVPVGHRTWRWPVESLSRDGLSVTMRVGPME